MLRRPEGTNWWHVPLMGSYNLHWTTNRELQQVLCTGNGNPSLSTTSATHKNRSYHCIFEESSSPDWQRRLACCLTCLWHTAHCFPLYKLSLSVLPGSYRTSSQVKTITRMLFLPVCLAGTLFKKKFHLPKYKYEPVTSPTARPWSSDAEDREPTGSFMPITLIIIVTVFETSQTTIPK